MNGISEQDLLKGVNEKHELMFKHFYECYYRIAVSRAYAMIRNMEVSEEFVNDIFIKLWEKKLHFPDLKALLSYLYRAVKRKCLNYLQRIKPKNFEDIRSIPEPIQPESEEAWFDWMGYLDGEVRKMPSERQNVMRLFLKGYTDQEIAEKLGKNIHTVSNTRRKALEILRISVAEVERIVLFFWFLISYGHH